MHRLSMGIALCWLLSLTPLAAQSVSGVTAEDIEVLLTLAGYGVEMDADTDTGDPYANGTSGDYSFSVATSDCDGGVCSTLVFFANFNLDRDIVLDDFKVVNKFNDTKHFGRAYLRLEDQQAGVDMVINLAGGVQWDHASIAVGRFGDIIQDFVDHFVAQVGAE